MIIEHLRKLGAKDMTIVSPDAGGAERAGLCETAGRRAGDYRQAADRSAPRK